MRFDGKLDPTRVTNEQARMLLRSSQTRPAHRGSAGPRFLLTKEVSMGEDVIQVLRSHAEAFVRESERLESAGRIEEAEQALGEAFECWREAVKLRASMGTMSSGLEPAPRA
jgi:hypothetical protein